MDLNAAVLPVNFGNFAIGTDINIITRGKGFCVGYHKIPALFYHFAYVIGKTAVGKGNIRTAFEHNDWGIFI
jgi:hypothetical protein